jgi:hypothetical protein
MLYFAAVVRTDVSKARISSIIMETRFGELGTILAVTQARYKEMLVALMMEATNSSETLVFKGTTRCNIPEDSIFRGHG